MPRAQKLMLFGACVCEKLMQILVWVREQGQGLGCGACGVTVNVGT